MRMLPRILLIIACSAGNCFAISGGPFSGSPKIVGTYAGVLRGAFDPTSPISSNSIGVFSMGVPQTGTGTGKFVMFAQGRVFSGTVQGTGDPKTAKLNAVLTATFNYTFTFVTTDAAGTQTINSEAVTASVNGNLKANVSNARGSFGTNATRITGTAILDIDQGQVSRNGIPVLTGVLSLSVSGFKQSDTAPPSSG